MVLTKYYIDSRYEVAKYMVLAYGVFFDIGYKLDGMMSNYTTMN